MTVARHQRLRESQNENWVSKGLQRERRKRSQTLPPLAVPPPVLRQAALLALRQGGPSDRNLGLDVGKHSKGEVEMMTKTTATNPIPRHPHPLHLAHLRLPLPRLRLLALPQVVSQPSRVNRRRLRVVAEVGFDKGCPTKFTLLMYGTLMRCLTARRANGLFGHRLEVYTSLHAIYVRTAR